MTKKITVIGVGKIGSAIIKHFANLSPRDYTVTGVDSHEPTLNKVKNYVAKSHLMDVTNFDALKTILKDQDAVISAASFSANKTIAEAALETGCSYFDLTEDVDTTLHVEMLSNRINSNSKQIFMPQCGLAPGFIGILANDLTTQFDELKDIKLRVGALPKNPQNIMKYNLTWSTNGLVNEYFNPGAAIKDGRNVETQPLEAVETLILNGKEYEAFNTSGGLGYLNQTFEGRCQNLDYKTIRYPGHAYLMKFLKDDLDMGTNRELFEGILDKSLPVAEEDEVVIFASVTGMKDGKLKYVNDQRIISNTYVYEEPWTAIQVTTASGVCAVVDLFFQGNLPENGFVKQEEVQYQDFINNKFGKFFNKG